MKATIKSPDYSTIDETKAKIPVGDETEKKKAEENAGATVTAPSPKSPDMSHRTQEQSQIVVPGVDTTEKRSMKLTVLRARNLEKQGMFDKGDPYVVVSYGKQMDKSNVVKGNLNPEWNLQTTFNITAGSPNEILLEVYDKDTITKDDFMGRATVPVSEIPKLINGCWIPLKDCKTGEVFIMGEIISTIVRTPESKTGQKGGIAATKAILTGNKSPDEDFEVAMEKQQQKIDNMSEKDFSTIKSAAATTSIEYDEDLEVAMEKQQHKIEKMSEKDFSTIKSDAAPTAVVMDTDLEAAMKKRQMKIDST